MVRYCGAKSSLPMWTKIPSVSKWTMSAQGLEKPARSSRCIMVTSCEMAELQDVVQGRNITIIEDAAHACGAEYEAG